MSARIEGHFLVVGLLLVQLPKHHLKSCTCCWVSCNKLVIVGSSESSGEEHEVVSVSFVSTFFVLNLIVLLRSETFLDVVKLNLFVIAILIHHLKKFIFNFSCR